MMQEDYTQPFYVPIGEGKLNLHTGIRGGYFLPPLEEPKQKESPDTNELLLSQYLTQRIKKLGQLEARLIYIQNKINEHIASSKRKTEKPKGAVPL